jgi:hypothetical protein
MIQLEGLINLLIKGDFRKSQLFAEKKFIV